MSHEVHAAAKKSLFALFFQSGYSAVLGLIANVVLTVMVDPKILGIYFSVLAVIGLCNYISDIGLASALIQKKEITRDDEVTVFTIQTTLIGCICAIGISSAQFLQQWYGFPPQGIYLLWALFVGFFISSLKTVPSVLLERRLVFATIVKVQMTENTLFYIFITIGALLGQGLMTFVYAVLARSLVGCVLIYVFTGWKPAYRVHMQSVRTLLSFGIPFQASSFLALFKDELVTIYLSKTLGFVGVGYIGWAKKWAEAPLRIIMDNVSKVMFPLFSRLQGDREDMRRSMFRYLSRQTMVLLPSLLCMALLVSTITFYVPKLDAMITAKGLHEITPQILQVVPGGDALWQKSLGFVHTLARYRKWQPAMPIFFVFLISAALSSLSTPFMNIFHAVKKPHIPLFFMIFWTAATWVGVTPMTQWFGPVGFAYLQVILSCTVFLIIPIAKSQKLL